MPLTRAACLVWIALGAFACGPPHIAPFTPHKRVYDQGKYAQRDPSNKPSFGSLYSDANGAYLTDTRAVRVGDLVVIQIVEAADAQGDTSTKLTRDSTQSTGMDTLFGLITAIKKAHPDFDPTKLVEYSSSAAFAGEGNTHRKGTLSAAIAVRVAGEMPNGDLFLEGTKVVLINNEEYHLYVSGLVRPADIAQDNSVASTRIADAQIEFTGRGDLADQNRKGWLGRAVDALNPF